MYCAHYDHLGIVPGHAGRQHLQRRDRQCHRLRHPAGDCARLGRSKPAPKRSSLLRGRHRRRAGAARLGVPWASIRRFPPEDISLGLNYDDVPPLGVPRTVNIAGAERTTFYPDGAADGDDFRPDHRSRSQPERRPLLPLRSLQLRHASASRRSPSTKATCSRAQSPVGNAAGRGVRREALPPAQRRISSRDGLPRGRGDGALRDSRWAGRRRTSRPWWDGRPATSSRKRERPAAASNVSGNVSVILSAERTRSGQA